MEALQTTAPDSSSGADQKFHFVANSLAKLLETARRELEGDREGAKASLLTASHILKAEIEPCSGATGSTRGGLAAWQMVRVRAYIDSNLHRTIHIRDLSAVARRSPAHFSRKFKLAVGDSPHAYVVRRRLERACHLMMTSAEPLSEIALSVGFSDQAHLCRLFRQAFGQSPANWRREREIPDEVTSRTGEFAALREDCKYPFFANQLISVLVEEGLRTFDYSDARWSYGSQGEPPTCRNPLTAGNSRVMQ